MVGILENKKTSKLLINLGNGEYEKIDPETVAKVVETEEGYDVQQHIDNSDIHFSKTDFDDLTKDTLRVENLKAGNNITLTMEEGTNDIIITASDHPTDGFLKKTDIQAEDNTIIITPSEDSNVVKIKANVPEISNIDSLLVPENIKSGDEIIKVEYVEGTNDVLISSTGKIYSAGDGIEINESIIVNTKPDQEVILESGKNVHIEGTYPKYIINSSSREQIEDWKSNEDYWLGEFTVYRNSIYRCIEEHTSGEVFEISRWELLAGYKIDRFYYLDEQNEIIKIILPMEVPNKDVLTINVGGIILQAHNYELTTDRATIILYKGIPAGEIVEITIAHNEVINEFDNGANIQNWKSNDAYGVGNMTIYQNGLYQCIENHISTDTFDQSKWKLVAGYIQEITEYIIEEETTSLTLPTEVYRKDNIMINVNGFIVRKSDYELKSDYSTIEFKNPLPKNTMVEITVFSNMVLQQLDIPSPIGHSFKFLRVNSYGDRYELIDSDELKEQMGLTSYTNYEGNANKYAKVNEEENDIEYVSVNKLASDVSVRKIADGFNLELTKDWVSYETYDDRERDYSLNISSGSVMSDDGEILITLKEPITKNLHKPFEVGNTKGSALNFAGDAWTQPVMTSPETPFGQVIASDEQTDREAWRAMDIYESTGNGWLSNSPTAIWKYIAPFPICITSIDFYNNDSDLNNRPKNVQIFVGNELNSKNTFVCENKNNYHIHVEIDEPEWDETFGLNFLSSYGDAIGGMKHIRLNGLYQTYVSKLKDYEVYVISNDDSSMVEIATIYKDSTDVINNIELPEGFTKKAKIGSFSCDDTWTVYNVYPPKTDLANTFMSGISGVKNGNRIDSWVSNASTNVAICITEMWGENVPYNGYITFKKPFKNECIFAYANGEKVSEITKTGFRVPEVPIDKKINWYAKGF